LKEVEVKEITVDVCDNGCGGIWFDNYELNKVDEPHESMGEGLLELHKDEQMHVDHDKQRHCPKCETIPMMRHFFSVKHEVEVDECPQCGGYWLDHGELSWLRNLYTSEEERREAAAKYFTDIMDVELEPLRKKSQEQLQKAQKIAHMFRFLCPSYYIPGKQPWGAY
jgi:Zn-finger nucleic acid-binding protein